MTKTGFYGTMKNHEDIFFRSQPRRNNLMEGKIIEHDKNRSTKNDVFLLRK